MENRDIFNIINPEGINCRIHEQMIVEEFQLDSKDKVGVVG